MTYNINYPCQGSPTSNEHFKGWQWGYKSVCFLAQYSFLHHQTGLNKARAKWRCRSIQYTLAVNFASGMGACAGIVEPFKHLLRVTAFPQFLVLELQAPMGSGQYGSWTLHISVIWTYPTFSDKDSPYIYSTEESHETKGGWIHEYKAESF